MILKSSALTICILLISNALFAQNYAHWAKGMGGSEQDGGNSIAVDDFGNVYTVGEFKDSVDFDPGIGVLNLTSAGNYDVFIQKLDPFGNLLWVKQLGSTGPDTGMSVSLDSLGNLYVTGGFFGTVNFNSVASPVNLTSFGFRDTFIYKIDANGNFLWVKRLGGSTTTQARLTKLDSSGNIYTIGSFDATTDFDPGPGIFNLTSAGLTEIFIQKMDPNGNFLWAKRVGGLQNDGASSLAIDNLGNLFITGFFEGITDFDPGPSVFNLTGTTSSIYLLKLDTNGNFIWAKQIGSSLSYDFSSGLALDNFGNLYMIGRFAGTVDFDPGAGVSTLTSPSPGTDVFVLKLDLNGNFIWVKQIGGPDYDNGDAIATDILGNIYTTGSFRGTANFNTSSGSTNLTAIGGADIFVHKIEANGNFGWAKKMGGSSEDRGISITVDTLENVYTTGAFDGSADFDPGPGMDVITAGGGFRDIFVHKLIPCNVSIATDVVTACAGYTWIDGIDYYNNNNTATYTIIGGASNGCDSMVTLDLTIASLPPALGIDTKIECNSYTWIDGNTYTSNNNTATFNIAMGAINGCDSLVTLDLTIINPSSGIDTQTHCNSYTWIDGNTYTSNNNTAAFNIAMGAINGCDSLVTLDLTIINPSSGIDTQTHCNAYTWIDGNTYTSNNNTSTFILSGGAANGCDSVVTLDLSILNNSIGTDTQVACDSFTWIDGITYTSNNNTATYTMSNGAVNGCDSIITLDLTIDNINTNTSLNVVTITSDAIGASYQWLDCDNGMSAISGETNQSFTATSNGNYAVEVSENSCVDTSSCISITAVSILENSLGDSHFRVAPNPTNGKFTVEFDKVQMNLSVQLLSISGQTIQNYHFQDTNLIEMELNQPNGIYLLELKDGNGKKTQLRIVKE